MELTRAYVPPRTLHYVYDPLCGWCYGAAPLVEAVRHVAGLSLVLHGGGLFSGASRRPLDHAWAEHVRGMDERIASLSGQTFSEAYYHGVLSSSGLVLDSEPPIAAVLAAEAQNGSAPAYLGALQRAYYQQGRAVMLPEVLCEIAREEGLDEEAFVRAMEDLAGEPVQQHMAESRRLMRYAGGSGFPTFLLQAGERWHLLDMGPYLGKPDHWAAHLAGLHS